ncbi:MAG: hypothetical protein C0597_17260 [Marinilabiliales bacterium]|nr:MAG: hypothetical protein C0597_17260 [Marinilabiliales bacterium]
MKKLYILILLCFATLFVAGQSISSYVIASAGESNEAGGINISWTLGEIAIETLEDNANTLVLTQGFQQGYFEITSVGEPLSNNFSLNIYPNPASDFVWVDLDSKEIVNAVIELYDLEGRLLYNDQFNVLEGPNKVSLQDLNASQYIIRVVDSSGNILQTFKLIKR